MGRRRREAMGKRVSGIYGGCGGCAGWLALGSGRERVGGVRGEKIESPASWEGIDPRVRGQKVGLFTAAVNISIGGLGSSPLDV